MAQKTRPWLYAAGVVAAAVLVGIGVTSRLPLPRLASLVRADPGPVAFGGWAWRPGPDGATGLVQRPIVTDTPGDHRPYRWFGGCGPVPRERAKFVCSDRAGFDVAGAPPADVQWCQVRNADGVDPKVEVGPLPCSALDAWLEGPGANGCHYFRWVARATSDEAGGRAGCLARHRMLGDEFGDPNTP